MTYASDLEGRIVALIRDTLQIEVPATGSDLIDLGLLDSLAIVSLIAEIELSFGFELPLDDFDVEHFRNVERMAAFLATSLANEGAA
ncbi:MAG: acyl carrier protein [Acidimicrobiales bacterium]